MTRLCEDGYMVVMGQEPTLPAHDNNRIVLKGKNPSGSKCSVLLHILALALNPLEQICLLSVHLSVFGTHGMVLPAFLFFIISQPSHMQMYIFYIPFSSLFTRLCASYRPYFIFSQELSILFLGSSFADSREQIYGCSSSEKKKLHLHLQTPFCPTDYKPLSDLMSGFPESMEKRICFYYCPCIIKKEDMLK